MPKYVASLLRLCGSIATVPPSPHHGQREEEMAHAHASTYAQQMKVAVKTGDEIHIDCGPFSVRMTFEEAASLAANLLNAVGATPVAEQELIA